MMFTIMMHFQPSPFQVIAAGFASCTGLSIFLIDALRSVGVPARLAGSLDYTVL